MLPAAIILAVLVLCIFGALALHAIPTRRERLTAAALSGLLAARKGRTSAEVARLAVQHADESIRRLDSTTEGMS